MKSVFVDTLYWAALVKPRDPWKEAARKARTNLGMCSLVTTDEVLTEFLNLLSGFGSVFRDKAVQTVRAAMTNPNVRVLQQTRETFLLALDRYEKRRDKEYSLVDCASMEAMDREGIREVLTNDDHFKQESYIILIK